MQRLKLRTSIRDKLVIEKNVNSVNLSAVVPQVKFQQMVDDFLRYLSVPLSEDQNRLAYKEYQRLVLIQNIAIVIYSKNTYRVFKPLFDMQEIKNDIEAMPTSIDCLVQDIQEKCNLSDGDSFQNDNTVENTDYIEEIMKYLPIVQSGKPLSSKELEYTSFLTKQLQDSYVFDMELIQE